jgi:hypothetical protein
MVSWIKDFAIQTCFLNDFGILSMDKLFLLNGECFVSTKISYLSLEVKFYIKIW